MQGTQRGECWKEGGWYKIAKGFLIKHFYFLGVLVSELCKWQLGYILVLETGSLFSYSFGVFLPCKMPTVLWPISHLGSDVYNTHSSTVSCSRRYHSYAEWGPSLTTILTLQICSFSPQQPQAGYTGECVQLKNYYRLGGAAVCWIATGLCFSARENPAKGGGGVCLVQVIEFVFFFLESQPLLMI